MDGLHSIDYSTIRRNDKKGEYVMKKDIHYHYTGPCDSKKEGWNKPDADSELKPGRIEIDTYMGTLIAEVAADSLYPGIWLSFRRPNSCYEQTVALLEDTRHEGISLRVWEGNKDEESDFSKRVFVEVPADGMDKEIYGEDV